MVENSVIELHDLPDGIYVCAVNTGAQVLYGRLAVAR
jgi:hypothetical protein